jgi:hypothetical protein
MLKSYWKSAIIKVVNPGWVCMGVEAAVRRSVAPVAMSLVRQDHISTRSEMLSYGANVLYQFQRTYGIPKPNYGSSVKTTERKILSPARLSGKTYTPGCELHNKLNNSYSTIRGNNLQSALFVQPRGVGRFARTRSTTLHSLLCLWVCQIPFTIHLHNPHAKDLRHGAALCN